MRDFCTKQIHMILSRQHFDIGGKTIIEKIKFNPPLSAHEPLESEACFLHVKKGSSELYFPNSSIQLNENENVLMKCGNYLNRWPKKQSDSANEAILIHVYPEVLSLIFEQDIPDFLTQKNQTTQHSFQSLDTSTLLKNYLESLEFYFAEPTIVTEELIGLKLKELLLLLYHSHFSEELKAIFQNLFQKNHYEFKHIIKEHLYDDLSLTELSGLCGMSLSGFKRKFKDIYEQSPKQYINQKRIEKGQELLTTTELNISEIGYEIGFNDIGYFSKVFKSKMGLTPTEYKIQSN